MAKNTEGNNLSVRLLAARRRALVKLGAPGAGRHDGLVFGKTIAVGVLGVSPKVLDKIVAPVGKAMNRRYRKGPEVLLYDPRDLLAAKKKRAYREGVAKRATAESKDWLAFMEARYGSPKAAIPDGAGAPFKLNRYTRHATRSTLRAVPEGYVTDIPPLPASAPATLIAELEPPWCSEAAGGAANDSANGSRDKIAAGRPPEHNVAEDHAPEGAAPLIVDLLAGTPHASLQAHAASSGVIFAGPCRYPICRVMPPPARGT